MKLVAGGAVALTLALLAGTAAAQEAPTPPPVVAAPPGAVHVHLRSYRARLVARVYSRRADDSWGIVCETPCTAEVAAGTELRITMGHEDDPHSYVVPSDAGSDIDVEVRPASLAPAVGGIVMMGVGGGLAVCGFGLLALDSMAEQPAMNSNDGVHTAAYVLMGVGAAAALVGLLWYGSRSHEPRTTDQPSHTNVYGRGETFLADAATSRRREPTTVPAALTPLKLGFTF